MQDPSRVLKVTSCQARRTLWLFRPCSFTAATLKSASVTISLQVTCVYPCQYGVLYATALTRFIVSCCASFFTSTSTAVGVTQGGFSCLLPMAQ